ncbi:hypothetical protein B0O80DRAFT_462075 [Mortierella sp. GBAus27b]|nr:hypothetical protein B0O80DRAFT_462075 [Mortierella sp. GBAus27b]
MVVVVPVGLLLNVVHPVSIRIVTPRRVGIPILSLFSFELTMELFINPYSNRKRTFDGALPCTRPRTFWWQ